jgi:hypothetical protein
MRAALFLCALCAAASAKAAQHSAIINLEGCASITWATQGYATLGSLYAVTDDLMNNGTTIAIALCDAELPPDATAFDYAEFEYIPGSATNSPWVVAFATGRWQGTLGAQLNWLQEIGWCGGAPPISEFLYPLPITVITVCQTSGALDWSGMADQARAADLSVVFLVVMPGILPSWDGNDNFAFSQAFRIVEYFEQ